MRDVFYFTDRKITLDHLQYCLKQEGYDVLLSSERFSLQVSFPKESKVQIYPMDIASDFLDEDSIEVIKNKNFASVFCISHDQEYIEELKGCLTAFFFKYGGWVGNDSDYFEPIFDQSDIHEFSYSE